MSSAAVASNPSVSRAGDVPVTYVGVDDNDDDPNDDNNQQYVEHQQRQESRLVSSPAPYQSVASGGMVSSSNPLPPVQSPAPQPDNFNALLLALANQQQQLQQLQQQKTPSLQVVDRVYFSRIGQIVAEREHFHVELAQYFSDVARNPSYGPIAQLIEKDVVDYFIFDMNIPHHVLNTKPGLAATKKRLTDYLHQLSSDTFRSIPELYVATLNNLKSLLVEFQVTQQAYKLKKDPNAALRSLANENFSTTALLIQRAVNQAPSAAASSGNRNNNRNNGSRSQHRGGGYNNNNGGGGYRGGNNNNNNSNNIKSVPCRKCESEGNFGVKFYFCEKHNNKCKPSGNASAPARS